ncbi:MAG: hypothetical protein P3X24_001195 [bacterium]|nr:hypothetical protein [bacterium]
MSKPQVPIQEPTGKFTLPAPTAKPPRRPIRKFGRVRKLFAWLWRNAEPLAWSATLGALALSLWFSPRTQLTRLVVQGAPAEARAAVEQAIRTHLRAPIALSDAPRRTEHALNTLDWTLHARWRAAGIGVAHIQITPRAPEVLIENADGARIFADPTGFVFLPPNRDAKPLSGRIRLGQDYPTPQRGSVLNSEMRKAFTILQQLHRRTDVQSLLVQVSKAQGIRMVCNLQRGTEPPFSLQVRFGDARALTTQLERLNQILEMPSEQLRKSEYIDISVPGAEVLKPRHSGGGA